MWVYSVSWGECNFGNPKREGYFYPAKRYADAVCDLLLTVWLGFKRSHLHLSHPCDPLTWSKSESDTCHCLSVSLPAPASAVAVAAAAATDRRRDDSDQVASSLAHVQQLGKEPVDCDVSTCEVGVWEWVVSVCTSQCIHLCLVCESSVVKSQQRQSDCAHDLAFSEWQSWWCATGLSVGLTVHFKFTWINDHLMTLAISHLFLLLILLMLHQVHHVSSSNHTSRQVLIGYLTGSLRRLGDSVYARPGQTISGAISYAVEQINKYHPLVNNHSLAFVVAETYGDESESIRNTAKLWSRGNVSVYIGPQETCVHEARMAASFNLPMISYVSILMTRQLNWKSSLPVKILLRPRECACFDRSNPGTCDPGCVLFR